MLTHRSVALAGSQGRSAPIELHNADAERSTLAAMILGPEGVEGARAVVGTADFYLVAHQRVSHQGMQSVKALAHVAGRQTQIHPHASR